MPPEMVHNMKSYYQNLEKNMQDLSKSEQPWSHDVWSLGIVLIEIISGCQIDKADSTFI